MRLGQVLPFAALPFVFALGWWSHSRSVAQVPVSSSESKGVAISRSDAIRTSSSAAQNAAVNADGVDRSFDILDAKKRDDLEGTIRGVPFSFLKQIYLDRQDAEWKKTEEYYQQIPLDDTESMKKQSEEFFKQFQSNSGGSSSFTASSEWTLRGGKRVPVIFIAQIYSTKFVQRTDPGGWVVSDIAQGDATLATTGEDLCYSVSAYFRVGDTEKGRYASEGTGTCLNYVSVRDGKPFVLFNNNSKVLIPYFDRASVPLPGFGTDIDSDPQWYDSNGGKWFRLARVRWESISKEEFGRIQSDLQADVIRN